MKMVKNEIVRLDPNRKVISNAVRAAIPTLMVAGALGGTASNAHAADRYWTNAAFNTQTWNTPGNWNGGVSVPANGDNLYFGPFASPGVTIAAGTSQVNYNLNAGTIFFTNPNALTAQVQAGSTLTLNNVTFNSTTASPAPTGLSITQTGTGVVTLGSNATWDIGGTGSAFSGGLTVGRLDGNFGVTKKGARLLSFIGATSTFTGGVTNQQGTVFVSSFAGNGNALGTGAFTFNNQGAFNTVLGLNAANTTTINNAIVNNNTFAGNSAFIQTGGTAAFYTYTLSGAVSKGANFATGNSLFLQAGGGNALAMSSATLVASGDWSGYTVGATADGITAQGGGTVLLNAANSIAPTNYVVGGNLNNSATEGTRLVLGGAYTMNQKVSFNGAANGMRNGFGTRAASGTATLAGDSTGTGLALNDADGANIFAQTGGTSLDVSGRVTGTAAARLRINDGYTFSSGSSGTINGTNALQSPTGTVVLGNAANTYAGATDVVAGTLLVNGANTGTGAVNVGVNGVATSGQAGVTAATSRVITGVSNATAGTLQIGQAITGTGIPAGAKITGITIGASTATISIDQTTTAAAANVSFATTAFATTATLGGSGSIAGAVTVNAGSTLAPGNSPGILSVGSNVTLAAGSTYSVELQGLTAGTTYDQLALTGATGGVTLAGANLVTAFSGFTPTAAGGDKLYIINAVSDALTVTGTFAGLADDALVTSYGSQDWFITYNANAQENSLDGGNDVALYTTAAAVPEPTSLALLGLAGLFATRRRRA